VRQANHGTAKYTKSISSLRLRVNLQPPINSKVLVQLMRAALSPVKNSDWRPLLNRRKIRKHQN